MGTQKKRYEKKKGKSIDFLSSFGWVWFGVSSLATIGFQVPFFLFFRLLLLLLGEWGGGVRFSTFFLVLAAKISGIFFWQSTWGRVEKITGLSSLSAGVGGVSSGVVKKKERKEKEHVSVFFFVKKTNEYKPTKRRPRKKKRKKKRNLRRTGRRKTKRKLVT